MKSQEFKAMIKNKKVCIVTDPPFNIGYHYEEYKDKRDDYNDFIKKVLTMYDYPFIVVHYPENLYQIAFDTKTIPTRVVSWVYNSNTNRQHRDIGFFNIKPDFRKVIQPYKNPNDKRIKERIANGKLGSKLYDWWNINQVKNVSKKEIDHPCVMPLKVMENIVGIIPNDYIIFDPFLGSGTTALACKNLKRTFIGCDISEKYCNIAIKRLTRG